MLSGQLLSSSGHITLIKENTEEASQKHFSGPVTIPEQMI